VAKPSLSAAIVACVLVASGCSGKSSSNAGPHHAFDVRLQSNLLNRKADPNSIEADAQLVKERLSMMEEVKGVSVKADDGNPAHKVAPSLHVQYDGDVLPGDLMLAYEPGEMSVHELGTERACVESFATGPVSKRGAGTLCATTEPPILFVPTGPVTLDDSARTWVTPAGDVDELGASVNVSLGNPERARIEDYARAHPGVTLVLAVDNQVIAPLSAKDLELTKGLIRSYGFNSFVIRDALIAAMFGPPLPVPVDTSGTAEG
jgi:hypothetical protein